MRKVGTTATFKKGMIVKVLYGQDLWCPISTESLAKWNADPSNHRMGDDGETRLPPRNDYRMSDGIEVFKIVRARVSAPRGYYDIKGCALVLDAKGKLWWIERKNLC